MTTAGKTDLSTPTLRALRRILRTVEVGRRQLASSTGLSPSQLLVLREVSGRGQSTPSTIALSLHLSQATITAIVDRLAANGLLSRQRSQKDKRQVILTLTAEGRKVLSQTPDMLQFQFEKRFDTLPGWEQAMILAAVDRLASILGAEDFDAAPLLDGAAIDQSPRR